MCAVPHAATYIMGTEAQDKALVGMLNKRLDNE